MTEVLSSDALIRVSFLKSKINMSFSSTSPLNWRPTFPMVISVVLAVPTNFKVANTAAAPKSKSATPATDTRSKWQKRLDARRGKRK